MEKKPGLMVIHTKGNTKTAKSKVRASFAGMKETNTMAVS